MADSLWEQRVRQKAESRAADAEALANGTKTAEDLRRENGAFRFPRALIRLSPSAARSARRCR